MVQKYFILKIIFIILLPLVIIRSQGMIQGVITDSLSHSTLVGANIFLMGTSIGGATNLNGEYSIKNIPEGTYTLRISYIGYKTKDVQVDIETDKSLQLDFTLVPDVLEGEEVVITSQALGQMSAINQQRTSNTIINVVSEEKIKELPDQNAAETIGRLPGVSVLRSGGEANKVILRGLDAKFVNITINGVKIPPTDPTSRGVDLSMFSQGSLAGIELYKALTPDKDADALAGSVNLVTKKAPETRIVRMDLKGNYNDMMESVKQYDFSLHYGERFLENVMGLQFTGYAERKIRSNERINVDYAFNQSFAGDYFINDFVLEFTDESRKRDGLSLLLDFNTPDNGVIRFNNVYGFTERDFILSTRDYPAIGGGSQSGNPVYNYRDREQKIATFNSSLNGDNEILGLNVDWGLSFGQSESDFPYDYEMIFVEPSGMNPVPHFRSNPEQLINYAVNNFANANLYWAYFRTQENFDKEKTGYLDIGKQFLISNLFSGEIKAGGKVRIKDRSNVRSEDFTPYYLGRWMTHERLPDGSFRPKDFTGTYFEEWWLAGGGIIPVEDFFANYSDRNVYDLYLLNPLIDRERLRQWQELNQYGAHSSGSTAPNAQEIWVNPLIKYDDYDITERVYAGYLMATLNIGQDLTLIGGVRIENEDNDYISSYMPSPVGGFPVTANSIRDTSSSASQTVVLPNLNISYRPTDFINIRVAVYKALSRPDFNMRLDRYIAGRPAEVGSQQLVYVGYPGLKTVDAWNYEINTTFFGNEIGLISLSAYYKEINNMYHMLNNFNTVAERDANGVLQDSVMQFFGINWKSQMSTSPYDLTLPYNSPDPTKVWGFEFEHQINFHFLPGLLKNIVLSYNASIIRSETTIYGSRIITYIDTTGPFPLPRSENILVTETEKLEGMPEFLGNISLGYDIAGFSARVSLFHKGEHNVSFSASGTSDQITNAFTRIDVALKQKITDFLSVFVNVNNVTNVEDGSSYISREYNYTLFDQSEKYGLTADLGITLQF
jgi:TonB-dependent receptor